jgi:hypothetical protein
MAKMDGLLRLVDGLIRRQESRIILTSIIMDIKNSNESRKRKKSNAKNLLIEKFDEEQNLIKYLEVFQS